MTLLRRLRTLLLSWGCGARLARLEEAVVRHLAVLPVASAQLRDTNRQVEAAVARVGAGFGRMVESARAGTEQASRLVDAGAAGESTGVSGLLTSSRKTLEDLLVGTVRDSQICRALVERMAALERDMGQILKALADVDRISLANTTLALNARIEAAHMGDRGQGFELVAQELWVQSQHSEQITEEIRAIILRLAADAQAAAGEIGIMTCADQAGIAALQSQVHDALDRLKNAHEQTARVLADGEARNRELSREIATAVETMQFQDRVSQQIMHVAEALEAMQQAIAAPLGDAGASDRTAGAFPASYTMEAERSVHATVLGEGREAGPQLDDVEIF